MGLYVISNTLEGKLIRVRMVLGIDTEDRLISIERLKELRKEELPTRRKTPFYPDFDNDIFAGVL